MNSKINASSDYIDYVILIKSGAALYILSYNKSHAKTNKRYIYMNLQLLLMHYCVAQLVRVLAQESQGCKTFHS